MPVTLLAIAIAGMMLTGCGEEPETEDRPRPVTVRTLEDRLPVASTTFAGLVQAWAAEVISAQVPGQIEFVVVEGEYVEGRWREDGQVLLDGDVIARIDPDSYQAALRAAEAELERRKVQRDVVVPAEVAEAETVVRREQEELDRIRKAAAQGAANEIQVIAAEAAVEIAQSSLQAAEASREEAKAAVLAAEAEVDRARLQLDRATIYAPFSGEVAEVLREAGGYAAAGTPIVELVMMDPVKVEMTVSARTARSIREWDEARVMTEGLGEPIRARVHDVAATANPRTLTFNVTLLARNFRLGDPAVNDRIKSIGGIFAAQPEDPRRPTSIFVPERRVLQQSGDEYHVWRLEPVPSGRAGREILDAIGERSGGETYDRAAPTVRDDLFEAPSPPQGGDDVDIIGDAGAHETDSTASEAANGTSAGRANAMLDEALYRVQRVPVVPGTTRRNYQGVVIGRTLAEPGDLQPYDLLAFDPPDNLQDGDLVRVASQDWVMRPGDVVRVVLPSQTAPRGFYVPATAINYQDAAGDTARIFVYESGKARAVRVRLLGLVENEQRIELVGDGSLAGQDIILEGAHYLQDGEEVQIVAREAPSGSGRWSDRATSDSQRREGE